jgi:hypothetical protein
MSYVKSLHASDLGSRSGTQCDVTPIQLLMTNDGFPILPAPWKGSEYQKQELEEWFILYIGQHDYPIPQAITYLHAELANNGRSCHVPFKAIVDRPTLFISPEYLSAGFKLRDSWNMHKSVIEDFFDHVLQRQLAQGPKRAFRFKGIKASDGSVTPAHF